MTVEYVFRVLNWRDLDELNFDDLEEEELSEEELPGAEQGSWVSAPMASVEEVEDKIASLRSSSPWWAAAEIEILQRVRDRPPSEG